MSYGRSKTQEMINEPVLFLGTVTDPTVIGDGVTGSPSDIFTGDDVGFIESGSLIPTLLREFSELLSGTPQQLVRKDIIRRQLTIDFNLAQFNGDTLALATQGEPLLGYDNGSGFVGDLILQGSAEDNCNQQFHAAMIIGERPIDPGKFP